MVRCLGPCGLFKPDAAFGSNGRGGKRLICMECYNKARRKTSRKSPRKRVWKFDLGSEGVPEQNSNSGEHADARDPQGPGVASIGADSIQSSPTGELAAGSMPAASSSATPSRPPRVEIGEETITRIEEHRLKRRVRELEAEVDEMTRQLSDGGEYHEVVQEVLARQGENPGPSVQPRERASHLKEATPLILASDWHLEEEVRPEQVEGRNRYNLEIAAHRAERFFEATRWAIDHQRNVFKIRDAILWGGGDFITNFLHEDNVESNLLHPTEAILFAQQCWIPGLEYLLQDPEIEQWILPFNDGNHGRLTKKMRSATRTQNSLEVFFYAQLAMHFKNEPRLKFILPTSSFTYLDDVYGRTIRFLHGDVFKYHGGVGGITVPLFRAKARWETVKHADLSVMGHWHQRICLPDLMVNGSLIGFNSYAADIGASFEAPVQSLRMLEPRRWCSSDIPLWVSELKDDNANACS